MAARSRWLVSAMILAIAVGAFFTGRRVEKNAQAARNRSTLAVPAASAPVTTPGPPSYRQIAVGEILALPFAEFYEALRSAPADARKKWAAELEKMPEGPRQTAAVSGFYKLLVQFDPAATAKAIIEIKDKSAQSLALHAAISAAPGFALPLMAELSMNPTVNENGRLKDFWTVLDQWSPLDPAAAAKFIDQHGIGEDALPYRNLISDWAALDPDAARNWMEKKGRLEEVPQLRQSFIEGWYEDDRAAAVSYVLGHVDDPTMKESIGDVLRSLYFDSKDEARKFIENLPDEKRQDAFRDAFQYLIMGEEEDTGDPQRTPRAVGDWVTEFPPEYWKGTLTSIFKWTRKPPDAMLAWIAQRPLSIREAVAAEYAAPFQMRAPDALAPVLQVADPILRDQLLKAMFEHMDPVLEEARTAVKSAAISPEQQSHVLQIIAAVAAERGEN